ncbi:hypothetical protein ABK040_008255 [Willaertia magna]
MNFNQIIIDANNQQQQHHQCNRTRLLVMNNNKIYELKSNNNLKINDDLTKIKQISCGESHIIVTTRTNHVYGMGNNKYHQLGIPNSKTKTELVEINLLTDDKDNKKIKTIDYLACGFYHSILICNQNEIYCAGHSYFNQTFGVNESDSFNLATSIILQPKEIITHVSCSTFSSLIIIDNWKIISCGQKSALKNNEMFDDGSEIFKKDKIKYCKFGDKCIFVFTMSGNVYISSNKSRFTILLENINKFIVGHMNLKYSYLDENNNLYEINRMINNPEVKEVIKQTVRPIDLELISTHNGFGFLIKRKKLKLFGEKSFKTKFKTNRYEIIKDCISSVKHIYILVEGI